MDNKAMGVVPQVREEPRQRSCVVKRRIRFVKMRATGSAWLVSLKQRFVSDDFSDPSGFHQRHLHLDSAISSRASFHFNDE
jgi:hypothetical protein